MTGADPSKEVDRLRRRRSAQHDDDVGIELERNGGRVETYTSMEHNLDGTRRNSGVTASGVEPTVPSGPLDTSPKIVRFSTDFEREALEESRLRSESGAESTASRTNEKPGLSISTGGEESGARSSGTILSPPHSPVHSKTPPPTPLSPSGRSRGHSLRRALFNRNTPESRNSEGSIIELHEAGSSSQYTGTDPHRTKGQHSSSKKSADTKITIQELEDSLSTQELGEVKKKRGDATGLSALPHYESWMEKRLQKSDRLSKLKIAYQKLRKTVLRIQELPPCKDGRQIELDATRKRRLIDERTGKDYVNNFIRSCRYTLWNFLPRQLFAQFSKLANFYFLCVSILQMIPGLSTTGSYTTIIPLVFFVSVSMAKEGYEDYRRYKLDTAENNSEASVLHAYNSVNKTMDSASDLATPSAGPLHWAKVKWHEVRVGDIVKMKRDEPAPADLVLLYSDGLNGMAYVETMALDGETNLKSKQTTASLVDQCATEDGLATCRARFVVEDPNLDLYKFEGRVIVGDDISPLTNNEVIYRGSILRNTPEAIGMVIYTGEECKIRMNSNRHPRIKAPHLQFLVNKIVIVIVVFVLSLAIFNTVAYQIWRRTSERKAWYISAAPVAFFPSLTAFFIMFNTMIPLSLYVALEIVKLAQMFLLNDIDMYDEKTDTPFEARTSTINEELGQISYVFSDKTGTLTDNEMKFRKMSVAGTAWLHDTDLKREQKKILIHKKRKRDKGKKPARRSLIVERTSTVGSGFDGTTELPDTMHEIAEAEPQWQSSARPEKSQRELRTHDLIRYIQHKPYTAFAMKARMFLLSIALCHTCLPEVQEDGTTDFQASSPDELALVRAAQELGYLIVNRELGTLTLSYATSTDAVGEMTTETYEILDNIEFSSKRKRMSVIVRFPNRRICVLTKGADSIIMQRLKLATLATAKVVEIEKRASRRKSMEAQQAIARRSSVQIDRGNSISRPSFTLARPSINRRSMNGQRLQPVKDELDSWLREREREVDLSNLDETEQHYSPRASAQSGPGGRHSVAFSEARSSMLFDDYEDLVDEALVNDEGAVIERCFQHINDFATEGLRTLLYAYRFMTEDEYMTWKKGYIEATTSLVDREMKIEQAGELIEFDLELAGATAIEDKLQVGVPQAIDKLRRANIKMWMLTGDKRETAINIGHSCRLIKDYSTVVVLDKEAGEVEKAIAAALIDINDGKVAHCVVVIDGQTLSGIEESPAMETLFYELAIMTDSVICCRASPSQKAHLVKAIRHRVKSSVTLAIGDGANDIAMIQEAHVGIGITGKEGLQAARTSDYSIAQWRFLTKLLLVHGRWNYIRTCRYVVGTFWKEMLFYLAQALYQRFNGYTGTSLYESWSLSMFNTLFTSLPVIFMGVFEKDLAASTLLAVPELYTKGQKNGGFNIWIYLGWMFMGACEAIIVFFCMWGLYGLASFTDDNNIFAMGDLTFTAVVIFISLKMQFLEMHNKSVLALTAFVLSVGGWFLWNIILSSIYPTKNKIYAVRNGFLDRFGQNALWWLTLILIIMSVVTFEIAVASLRTAWWPTDTDLFQELERDLDVRKRFEEASATELQMGWNRGGKGKLSTELVEREKEEMEKEQRAREDGVRVLLDNRPDHLEPSTRTALERKTTDERRRLSKSFGTVKIGEVV